MRLIAVIASNGAASLVSLLITVVVGRQDGPTQLGIYGICFAVMALTQLFASEIGLNRTLSEPGNAELRQVSLSRAVLVALIVAVPMFIVGAAMSNTMVMSVGCAIPGYVTFSFLRLWTMSEGRVGRGCMADAVLLIAVSIASTLVIALEATSIIVIVTWALVLPLSSWLLIHKQLLNFRPGWHSGNGQYIGITFGLQSLLGAGSVHVSTFLLAGLFGPPIVGAVRGASTLLGPVNMITTSVMTLSIRQLATNGLDRRRRTMLLWSALCGGIGVAGSVLILICVAYFGPWILGQSWPAVQPLVVWVGVDAILVSMAVVARAAHRVDRRGGAALRVSATSGGARLLALPVGGLLGGATGVAIALAFVSLMSGGLWWFSYIRYRRQGEARS